MVLAPLILEVVGGCADETAKAAITTAKIGTTGGGGGGGGDAPTTATTTVATTRMPPQRAPRRIMPASLSRAALPAALAAGGKASDTTTTTVTTRRTPTSADCKELWFTQTLDHFNTNTSGTYQERYFVNDTFFNKNGGGGGPILFYVGNEADVTLYVNATGLMWEHAEELGALLVFAEHRYYGASLVPGQGEDSGLSYLSHEQALADYAALVRHLRDTYLGASPSTPVIAVGGSYGGMLASWGRMKYPATFNGAIAGSAPILAFDGDTGEAAKHPGPESYWAVVTRDATAEYGGAAPACSANVRAAWSAIDRVAARAAGDGGKVLAEALAFCKPLDVGKPPPPPPRGGGGGDTMGAAGSASADVQAAKIYLAMAFDTMAMGNFPYPSTYLANGKATLPAYPVRVACEELKDDLEDELKGKETGRGGRSTGSYRSATTATTASTTTGRSAGFRSARFGPPDAGGPNDQALVAALGRGAAVFNNASGVLPCFDLPSDPDYDGIWDYLWCTELLPQESYFGRDGASDMFEPFAYDEAAITAHCRAKYGGDVTPRYDWIATEYGGRRAVAEEASNIVFSNGHYDPWRSGGVRGLNVSARSVWSIDLPSGAHHVDLMFSTPEDPPDLLVARRFEIDRIKEWVGAMAGAGAGAEEG